MRKPLLPCLVGVGLLAVLGSPAVQSSTAPQAFALGALLAQGFEVKGEVLGQVIVQKGGEAYACALLPEQMKSVGATADAIRFVLLDMHPAQVTTLVSAMTCYKL